MASSNLNSLRSFRTDNYSSANAHTNAYVHTFASLQPDSGQPPAMRPARLVRISCEMRRNTKCRSLCERRFGGPSRGGFLLRTGIRGAAADWSRRIGAETAGLQVETARTGALPTPQRRGRLRSSRVAGSVGPVGKPLGRAGGRGVEGRVRQTEVGQDLLDHLAVADGRDQTQPSAAVRAGEHVDGEGAAQQLGPRNVARAHVGQLRCSLGNCF